MLLVYACEFFLCFLLLEVFFLFSVLFQIRSVISVCGSFS